MSTHADESLPTVQSLVYAVAEKAADMVKEDAMEK